MSNYLPRFVLLRFTIRIASFLNRFDSFQDTGSIDLIRPQIESQKPLFARAYHHSMIVRERERETTKHIQMKRGIEIKRY